MKLNTVNSLQLELHVPDFAAAEKYYGLLGFQKVWAREPEGYKGYLVLQNDAGCILNFWGGNDDIYTQEYFSRFRKDTKRGYGVEIVIPTLQPLEALEAKLIAENIEINEPLRLQPWGLYDFRVEDPFGYYLRITTPHDITQLTNAVD